MMVDEVLAVGDATFAQKCADALPAAAQRGPDDPARHARHGEPAVALRPRDPDRGRGHRPRRRSCRGREPLPPDQLLRPRPGGARERGRCARARRPSRIADVWLENSEGERTRDFEHGSPIHVVAEIEAKQEIDRPEIRLRDPRQRRRPVFAASRQPTRLERHSLEPGDRVRFTSEDRRTRCAPGSYAISCGSGAERAETWSIRRPGVAELVVWGRAATRRTSSSTGPGSSRRQRRHDPVEASRE